MKLAFNEVCFSFGNKTVFDNLSFTIDTNKTKLPLAILGPSGCGKTTLLRLVSGLLKPLKGTVGFDGITGNGAKNGGKCGACSFVFQESRLVPWFNVLDNIVLPLEKPYGKRAARERALGFLREVRLENRASSFPAELSGGQKQRAAIARAFAYPAPLLLMDEPFHSLDIPLRIELMELTLGLLLKEERLALVVTHDPREAVFMGGRVIVLGNSGREEGPFGIVYDETIAVPLAERDYFAPGIPGIEKNLVAYLQTVSI
jgi:NitT/TauT family transport system ATP-binding protein